MTGQPSPTTIAPSIEGLDERTARAFLIAHKIELGMEDPRNALRYVTELVAYVDAVETQRGEEALAHEAARLATPTVVETNRPRRPYFAG